MAITTSSDATDPSPSSTSLKGLDGVNFFLAGMQSGFGPFVAVLLADEKWTQQNIGFVLSGSSFAGLVSQLPGGELLDVTRSKRFLVALGAIMVAAGALVIAQKTPAALGGDRYGPSFGLGERIQGTDRAFFLKVGHCRAVEMYDSVGRVQGERSLADVLLREPHYLNRRKHQTTGGKHGKLRLPGCFP
jgi:hypothetical protein